MTDLEAGPASAGPAAGGRSWRVTPLTVFLGVLAAVLVGYTLMALDLEWRTAAGRIGPGFFPRIVGATAFVLCVIAAVLSMRRPERRPAEGEAGLGLHPRMLLAIIGAGAVYYLVFLSLGAIVASTLFLLVALWLLDREHPVRVVAVSVIVPIGMYLLFQVGLNAGLPSGILPFL